MTPRARRAARADYRIRRQDRSRARVVAVHIRNGFIARYVAPRRDGPFAPLRFAGAGLTAPRHRIRPEPAAAFRWRRTFLIEIDIVGQLSLTRRIELVLGQAR
jgi:hypothetical protein